MVKNTLIAIFTLFVLAGLYVVDVTAPANAQSSCMHCNFAFGKCKQLKKDTMQGCQARHTQCVNECKGTAAAQPKDADKAKAADSKKKK